MVNKSSNNWLNSSDDMNEIVVMLRLGFFFADSNTGADGHLQVPVPIPLPIGYDLLKI